MKRHIRRLDPGLTPFGLLLLAALLLAATVLAVWIDTARAEEPEPPRYEQTSRGTARHADLVAEHFPPGEVATALRVMECESGGDPRATGAVGEQGLFQIYPRFWRSLADRLYWPGVSLYAPEVNVVTAAAIWRAMGWRAWSCYWLVRR